ncbi:MAG: DUF3426 domain-containing protein, partial [Burkholderiales bacterium]|nr:DUF3426 domain-containing protein [Burkholderiales bacterium]
MDLFTRCPACETVFRVTTRHLQASGGQVKCGRCQSVFDAFASLTANPLGESRSRRMSKEEQQLPREAQSVESFRTPTASGPATDPADPDAEIVGVNGDKSKAPADLVEHGTQAIKGDSAANLYEWEFKPTPRLRYRGVWRGLTLTLLVTALLQIGYIFRTQLMINIPSLRPVYELVCERLPCDIGLPRLAEQLNIDASDLQFVDPQRPNLVQLTALVRNRAR